MSFRFFYFPLLCLKVEAATDFSCLLGRSFRKSFEAIDPTFLLVFAIV